MLNIPSYSLALILSAAFLSISKAETPPSSFVESSNPLDGEQTQPQPEDKQQPAFWEQGQLTGDWGGARPWLEGRGVDFFLGYTGEILRNTQGGVNQGTIYDGLVSVGMSLDFEKLAGIEGFTFFIDSFAYHGTSLSSRYITDLSNTSNINVSDLDAIRFHELWFEKSFFGPMLSLRVGQLAADAEFFTSESSALFINSEFGAFSLVGANLPNPPIYPVALPGVRLKIAPIDSWHLQAAVYDGNGEDHHSANISGTRFRLDSKEGFLSFYEIGYLWNQEEEAKGLPGTYKWGSFFHTGTFQDNLHDDQGFLRVDAANTSGRAARHTGNYGAYFIADQMVFREPWEKNPNQGLSLFWRIGGAPADRNRVDFYTDTGFNYRGIIPGREDDILGFGFSYAGISGDIAESSLRDNLINGNTNVFSDFEAVYEVTYKISVTSWFQIQPDFQYISHPGGSAAVDDAIVVGSRFYLNF